MCARVESLSSLLHSLCYFDGAFLSYFSYALTGRHGLVQLSDGSYTICIVINDVVAVSILTNGIAAGIYLVFRRYPPFYRFFCHLV